MYICTYICWINSSTYSAWKHTGWFKKTYVYLIQLETAEILSNKTWGKFTTRIIQREDIVRRTWTRTFGELLVYLQWAIKRGHCIKDGCWNEYSSKLEMDTYIISGSYIYRHFANFQMHGVFELQIPTEISNQCMAFKFHVQKWRFPSWGYPSYPFQLHIPWNKPSINWDTATAISHVRTLSHQGRSRCLGSGGAPFF